MSHPDRRAVVNGPSQQDGPLAAPSDDAQWASLVTEAQTGSRESIRRFLDAIAPVAAQTCRRVMGSDHPDLEDVMQESLFACVKALPRYRFEGDIRSYVAKISLRLAIPARKRSAARWRVEDSVDGVESASVPAPTVAAEFALVARIFDDLAGAQREALFMRIVLGHSVQEISEVTGVSQNTVKKRLRLGKNILRRGRNPLRFWKRFFPEQS